MMYNFIKFIFLVVLAPVVHAQTFEPTLQSTDSNTMDHETTNELKLMSVNTLELWPECPAKKLRAAFEAAFTDANIVDVSVIETEVLKACTRTRNLLTQLISAETTLIKAFSEFRSKILDLETLERSAASNKNLAKIKVAELEKLVVELRADLTEAQKTPEIQVVSSNDADLDNIDDLKKPECSNPRPLDLIEWSMIGRGIAQQDWMVQLQAKSDPEINTTALVGEDFLAVRIISVDFEKATVTGMDCIGLGEISEINFDFKEANRDVVWFNDGATPVSQSNNTNSVVTND